MSDPQARTGNVRQPAHRQAGAEGATRSRQHDDLHRRVGSRLVEQGEVAVLHGLGPAVAIVRVVEREREHPDVIDLGAYQAVGLRHLPSRSRLTRPGAAFQKPFYHSIV